ncbi:ABC transporter permease [Apibacter muscae]|uniref:ABC transporter permease n=1 Tax=Apibacter muscae TaxID=2509004 RepID=A0A563DB90_9FLAO|nr:FtsX-like permease family protein [Apibacter muscae]TWP27319.1 ABC transporter permease [Apibacter muscae]TWP28540.1 ABC transporter permease [Apibacter muscae]
MNFTWFISKKIAFSKSNKKNLSQIIIRIGQTAVAIGIIVSVITLAIGIGSKKAIKQKMADFNGHITIKSYDSNNSYNSSKLNKENVEIDKIKSNPYVSEVYQYATKSGVIRTEKNFAGVILKGVSNDFDRNRFKEFIIRGEIPKYSEDSVNNEVLLPEKIAKEMQLDVDSSFVMFFVRENDSPIYRRFKVKGIYRTDIKQIDDVFVIGDIKHIQKLNGWSPNEIGGYDIFIDDIEMLNEVFPSIEEAVGFNNYAEKATTTFSQINDWIQIFDTNIFIILTIMMVVVIINLIMVLIILIIERTNSIGMLKTLGASNNQIRKIFINYTLIIMVPGLVIGNIIAIILLYIQKIFKIIKLNPDNYYVSSVPVYINFWHIGIISVLAIVISGIVLLFPSYLISKISPIKALKFQ